MEEVQGSRHFQISKAIFTDMKVDPASWKWRMPHWDGADFKRGACRSLSFVNPAL
jgi:hypothetical protein